MTLRAVTARSLAAAGLTLSLLVGACGPAAVGSGNPQASGSSVPGASTTGAAPSLPATENATYLAAAETELTLRRQLLADVHAAEVIGPGGAAVLAETEKLETAFGEKSIAEFIAEMELDLSATSGDAARRIAAVGPAAPPPTVRDNEWSGSLFGATSFMVSTWMSFAPELIANASGNQFVTESQNRNENHDTNLDGGLKEQLTLTQRLTLGQGRGRIVFDVVMTSAAVITKAATGEEVARRISTGNGHFEVNACPDANGVGEGKYRIVNQELVTRPDGMQNGGASTTEATFKVIDGEDAHLIQTEVQAAVSSGVHGTSAPADGTPGAPIDWNAQANFTVVIPASGTARIGDVTGQQSNNATDSNRGQPDHSDRHGRLLPRRGGQEGRGVLALRRVHRHEDLRGIEAGPAGPVADDHRRPETQVRRRPGQGARNGRPSAGRRTSSHGTAPRTRPCR